MALDMALAVDCGAIAPVRFDGVGAAPWQPCEKSGFLSGRIFCGKPVPTFPENAPMDEAVMRGTKPLDPARVDFTTLVPKHFGWRLDRKVATVTLDRPERKNPLTFASY